MKRIILAFTAFISLGLIDPAYAQEIYAGTGSSGTTTTTKPNYAPPEVHIVVPENAPEVRDPGSKLWQGISESCKRLYFDSTEPFEGCDPHMPYAVGFMHYDLDFWLPDILTGDNHCVLYFLKDINPADCPWSILDPSEITGIAVGFIF